MTAKAFFYQTLSPLHALPRLLETLYREGIVCLLYTPLPAQRDDLNALLWTYRADSFLPHGRCTDPYPHQQPILLSPDPIPLNGATALLTLDGEGIEDLSAFAAYYYLFRAGDDDTTRRSRDHWRRHQQAGHTLALHRQDERGWTRVQ
jgi:DNA polymerase-3 subunit chi